MMKTNQNYESPKMDIILFENDAWVFTTSGSDMKIEPSTASYEEYNDR
ncbi:MAG: hypothetical protein LUH23_02615 [Oscillospiraceae bacterium]|nr:hypothetical protein [Oscillospiraceae bacterium]